MYQPFHHSRVQISQGQIFWREVGHEGPAIIFVHGSWIDSSQWVPLMKHLSLDHHCFAPDILGCSESIASTKIHASVSLEVDCLAEYIKTLKLQQFCLVGQGVGAWIATSYALKYPEAVKGLVAIAPEGIECQGYKKQWGWFRGLLSTPSLTAVLLKLIYPLGFLFGQGKKIRYWLQQRRELLKWEVTTQLLYQRRWVEIQAEMLNERLSWLKLPTLILQGLEDSAIAQTQSKTYASMAPMAQLQIIEGGGNNLPLQMPEVVAQYIRQFLTQRVQFELPPSPQILDEEPPPDQYRDQEMWY